MVDFTSPPNIIITNGMLTDVFAGGTVLRNRLWQRHGKWPGKRHVYGELH